MNKVIYLILVLILFLSSGCSSAKPIENDINTSSSKLQVYASFYPLYFAVQEIAKDKVDLYSIIPNGVEPHDYEPTIRETAKIEGADLFIYNGAGMEPWGEKLSENLKAQNIPVINASEYVELRKIESEGHFDEHNSDEETHEHGVFDPHIWLDPPNMIKIGAEIKDKLCTLDSNNKDFYEKNYEAYSQKLMVIDDKYNNSLKYRRKNSFLVSHDAFGYLADRYELEQIPVLGITPHEEPAPKTLAKLIDLASEGDYRYIFLEILASPKTAEMIAEEANLEILTLNPISGLTEEQQKKGENYYTIMEQNLENLKEELVK